MVTPPKRRKIILQKLKNKYRLVIMNDGTLEEKFSIRLTPINVIVIFSLVTVTFLVFIWLMIISTPLKTFIPGYYDPGTKRQVARLTLQKDSLERELRNTEAFQRRIQKILNGESFEDDTLAIGFDSLPGGLQGGEDLSISQKPLYFERGSGPVKELLFPPVKGKISQGFNLKTDHMAIDITTARNEAVKSVTDGTVILATWTPETGNTIAIQHSNNIISVYKHNASLLKKVGSFVRAGEPVAITGNSGELSTGPHLHFELWVNGAPVDPSLFIHFN